MKTIRWYLLLVILLVGCGTRLPEGTEGEVQGELVSMDLDDKSVTIEHAGLPGGLAAGETDFVVADPKLLERVGQGDLVKGRFQVKSGKYVLSELSRTGRQ